MIYLQLFLQFFKTGLFAIGGGLATLPFLYEISDKMGWYTHADVADMIAVSESTPGAIGINMSTFAGYLTAGIPGGIVATLSLAAPSLIIIIIISRILKKFSENKYVEYAFYGLRAASIAMIFVAGINVAKITIIHTEALSGPAENILTSFFDWKAIILAVILFLVQRKSKLHPVVFIALSAVVGIVFRFAGA